MWGVKINGIRVTTEATGTISKLLRQYPSKKQPHWALHTAESADVKV